jgi:hypothetical protein
MRMRGRGSWLMASLVGLACMATLTACLGGAPRKPPAGVTATKGPVTVATNLSAYNVNEAIGVIVSNNDSTDYYAVSGKTACVIIQLERYNTTKKAWEPVDGCPTPGTAPVYAIAKNSQQQFTLAPTSSADINAWDAGLYRVTVTYTPNSNGVTDAKQAHSAAFNVR